MIYIPRSNRQTIMARELNRYSYEIGPIRPPSEGGSLSLLIRPTRNCPWNRCAFCYGTPYNHVKFEYRSVEEIKNEAIIKF